MDSKRPLRVNVIGRGPWGQNIVRTLKELGAEVPIVANRETGWQRAFEMNPDRICVAAHPSVNLPVVLECDKRGIPVWIEKPAALSLTQVEWMAKCKIPIFVDYTYLFDHNEGRAFTDIMSGVRSGKCHDFGVLYDWGPHVLSAGMVGGKYRRKLYDKPLDNAVQLFLGDPAEWPPFDITVRIHAVIDEAEKAPAYDIIWGYPHAGR